MRILFLSNWYPYPPDNGSKLRIFQLLQFLSEEHSVSLLSFIDRPSEHHPKELEELCESIHVVKRKKFHPHRLLSFPGLLSRRPRSFVDTYSHEMEANIRREIGEHTYDLVLASELDMAAYWPLFKNTASILEDLELGIVRALVSNSPTWWIKIRRMLTWLKLQEYLRHILPLFNCITVVSRDEAALVRNLVPITTAVEVVPNFIEIKNYEIPEVENRADSMIFMGSFRYDANYDAMTWFLEDVYPLIRDRIPGAQLTVTGDHAGLPLPTTENIRLTGYVEDVRPYLASSLVSLVPLRMGGGTRLKILESMALRTPVVSTSKGAEGLELNDGEHLLIADTPEDFADKVIRVLMDPSLRAQLAESAYDVLLDKYETQAVRPKLRTLIDDVTSRKNGISLGAGGKVSDREIFETR
jgi:glycosyltransferase involved in cell wall biosynthesis